ncbi:MAG TPA: alkaline phosphatase D family protein, partial [Thermomicrobiales bacterium]|nr:alkaline phosphatase D family protein [Thermomicrobiales bacterium]
AYQAYYEHQPLRKAANPAGPDLQLFRHRSFGDLVTFNVLDTRQYRTVQGISCNDDLRAEGDGFCPDSLDPSRTLLGDRQKTWLFDRFDATTARWNVLAQQIPFARIDNDADPTLQSFGGREMDKWDGYAYERDQVATAMASAAQARGFAPVVITGDVHANYVWDLKTDWDDQTGASIYGTEFVGTSISSNGDEGLVEDGAFTTECGNRNGNAHNHLFDNHRGYVLCDLTPETWESTYRIVSTVTNPGGKVSTLTSFVVEQANPGAQINATCTDRTPSGETS